MSKLLNEVGARPQPTVQETTGQALLRMGDTKAKEFLEKGKQGTVFIDEVPIQPSSHV